MKRQGRQGHLPIAPRLHVVIGLEAETDEAWAHALLEAVAIILPVAVFQRGDIKKDQVRILRLHCSHVVRIERIPGRIVTPYQLSKIVSSFLLRPSRDVKGSD